MTLDRLYDLADNENVKIYDYTIDNNIKGIYLNYDKMNAIALNYKNIDNTKEEKCILAEELGHYYYDATYNYKNIDKTLYDKQEYRAKKWAIKTLIPCTKLNKLAEEGCKYACEFAEELGVTEELINNAYDYYKCNNMIKY